jgi:hypothetical protein
MESVGETSEVLWTLELVSKNTGMCIEMFLKNRFITLTRLFIKGLHESEKVKNHQHYYGQTGQLCFMNI